ncbi:uncharacterized protein DUF1194 [Breoghania corrubedonensis]|uniref:Uncharacterized protein DUF1194 n=1 Tax=Breoghania corrubedonensis TaxID=665038 RepID=A0A2T5VFI1_9HYPH|nr:DUF1194 domain-containing protein [Breoghania corrubedonensis]PTW62512.1 uncharacterized protein DUF1194 [Breoghania corrubedonensis]
MRLYETKARLTAATIAVVMMSFLSTPVGATEFASYDPASEVDVELVLAVDISQSMDEEEQQVQRRGYVEAITSSEVMEAIRIGPTGRIAVTYIEWGGIGEQYVVADWQVIDGPETAMSFASKIAESPLRQVQRTSIAAALSFSVAHMNKSGFSGLRRVIDISGDGPNNQGGQVTAARDDVIAHGVTINGLPLMLKGTGNGWYHMPNLDHYYEDCVIGGPGSFMVPVYSTAEFGMAIKTKLVMEIAGLIPRDEISIYPAATRKPIACNLFN